jgi:hypothetical protein
VCPWVHPWSVLLLVMSAHLLACMSVIAVGTCAEACVGATDCDTATGIVAGAGAEAVGESEGPAVQTPAVSIPPFLEKSGHSL